MSSCVGSVVKSCCKVRRHGQWKTTASRAARCCRFPRQQHHSRTNRLRANAQPDDCSLRPITLRTSILTGTVTAPRLMLPASISMGVEWIGGATFPPTFCSGGTPCVLSPTFSEVNVFVLRPARCQILRLKFSKFNFECGSAPDPDGRAYSAPPNPLAGFKGGYF